MGFSKQEHWNGLPGPPLGDLLTPLLHCNITHFTNIRHTGIESQCLAYHKHSIKIWSWSNFTFTFHCHALEKEIATYSRILFFFLSFNFICWRLITLQYCSGFCHTLTWISHGLHAFPILIPPPTSLPIPSLLYSYLENPRDRGAEWAAVYGVPQSWTWPNRLSSSSNGTKFMQAF